MDRSDAVLRVFRYDLSEQVSEREFQGLPGETGGKQSPNRVDGLMTRVKKRPTKVPKLADLNDVELLN